MPTKTLTEEKFAITDAFKIMHHVLKKLHSIEMKFLLVSHANASFSYVLWKLECNNL